MNLTKSVLPAATTATTLYNADNQLTSWDGFAAAYDPDAYLSKWRSGRIYPPWSALGHSPFEGVGWETTKELTPSIYQEQNTTLRNMYDKVFGQ